MQAVGRYVEFGILCRCLGFTVVGTLGTFRF